MSTPARATDILFTQHGARRGIDWLREAYAMFSRARLSWLVLIALYYMAMITVNIVPLIGQLALPLLKPVFTVGLLAAAWTQERGGRPLPSHLWSGFRANLRALIPLGITFVLGITAAIAATWVVDGGLLLDLLAGNEKPTETLLRSGKLQVSLLVAALAALPTILALWFAPALVVFQDAGPIAALGASLRAALANWRPLALFGLAVTFGALLPAIVAQFVVMLMPTESTVVVVRFLLIAYGLMFAATLHIADYVSYRDIFHAGETLAPLSPVAPENR